MNDREIVLPIKVQRASSIRLYYSNSPQYDRPLIEHFHPEFEIQIMESGSGTYYYGGKYHSIEPHDIYFFRSNEWHYVTKRTADANGRPSTSFGFYFMPEFIQHFDSDVLGTKYMNIFSPQNLSFINNMGSYHMVAKEDYKTALKYYKKVLKMDPTDMIALQNGAIAAKKLGNTKLELKYREAYNKLMVSKN